MTSSEQRTARPPLWRALLLLGLLVGILGMHALAPGGGMAGHESGSAHMTTASAVIDTVCHDGCGSGHLHHADATCTSGALSGAPALPALVPDPSGSTPGAVGLRDRRATAQEGARAPPSLAELQLLRI